MDGRPDLLPFDDLASCRPCGMVLAKGNAGTEHIMRSMSLLRYPCPDNELAEESYRSTCDKLKCFVAEAVEETAVSQEKPRGDTELFLVIALEESGAMGSAKMRLPGDTCVFHLVSEFFDAKVPGTERKVYEDLGLKGVGTITCFKKLQSSVGEGK